MFVSRIFVLFIAPTSTAMEGGMSMSRRVPFQSYHVMFAVPEVEDHRSDVTQIWRSPVVRLWNGVMITFL